MALQLSASIYGANGNDWNKQMGVLRGFPTQGITIETLTTPTAYSGVTCLSIINLLPTGLQTDATAFYCPTAAATLITNSNA